jgi:sugar phosphate isomerase/epimerase
MSNLTKLAINFDEISDDFQEAADVMQELGIKYGELRTVKRKNFVFWSDEEIEEFKRKVNERGITIIAAATPLFKWYTSSSDPEVIHDSFGFNPRLSYEEKRQTIARAIEAASTLGILRLRIFSELKSADDTAGDFASNRLLEHALSEAASRNIDLLIENEPVCRIHTKAALVEFLNKNQSSNLKLWLDIANLLEIGETIDKDILSAIGQRIGYIHVKNCIVKDGVRQFVPAGAGEIDYDSVLPLVLSYCPQEVIVSVETHASQNEKISSSRKSLTYLAGLLNKYQKGENYVGTN